MRSQCATHRGEEETTSESAPFERALSNREKRAPKRNTNERRSQASRDVWHTLSLPLFPCSNVARAACEKRRGCRSRGRTSRARRRASSSTIRCSSRRSELLSSRSTADCAAPAHGAPTRPAPQRPLAAVALQRGVGGGLRSRVIRVASFVVRSHHVFGLRTEALSSLVSVP